VSSLLARRRRIHPWQPRRLAGGVFLVVALGAGVLLAHLSPLEGVFLVTLVSCAVGTCVEPLVGVAAGAGLGLARAYLHTEAPQLPEQLGQGFIVLALAVWVARGLRERRVEISTSPLLVALGLFLSAALLSLWEPVELAAYTVPEFLKWVQLVLVFLLVSQTLSARRLPWLVGALVLIGLTEASVGLWQFGVRGTGPDHFAIASLGEGFYRAYGSFEQPNPYAGYLGLILTLALGAAVGAWWGRLRPPHGATHSRWPIAAVVGATAVLVLGAALIASWSRGAWIGMAAALLVMAVALPRRTGWGLALMAVLIVGGLGLAALRLLPASMLARLTGFWDYIRFEDVRGVGINDANYVVLERFAHWQAALAMFRSHSWTGVGIGGYEPAYPAYALINWPFALGHAHNFYLTVAAETGIMGLLAYVGLWAVIFWQTWRATRLTTGFARGLAVGLLGAWTHLSVHHLLDNLLVNNVHLTLGILLGILGFITRGLAAGQGHNQIRAAGTRAQPS